MPPSPAPSRLRPPRRWDAVPRMRPFAPDEGFEALLAEANRAWAPLEATLIHEVPLPTHPLVIICYPPRSGSTLLGQLLARSGAFHYVTNFMARFWEAPYLAGLLEKRLGLRQTPFPAAVTSRYGVTQAPTDPHEFGFFWNHWLTFKADTHRIDPAAMTPEKTNGLRQELRAIRSLYDQPCFLKSDLVGLNPGFFHRLCEQVVFVVLRRELRYVAQSIYQARLDLYGRPDVYWSTRPSNGVHRRRDLPPAEQIALQLQGIYDDLYHDLEVTGAAFLEVQYERLCEQPEHEIERLLDWIGCATPCVRLQARPTPANRDYLPASVREALTQALDRRSFRPPPQPPLRCPRPFSPRNTT